MSYPSSSIHGRRYSDDPAERERAIDHERSECTVCGQRVSNRGHAQWSHQRGRVHRAAQDELLKRSTVTAADFAEVRALSREGSTPITNALA